ncbi:MAG: hypothetical protein EXS05_11460 [Planctomycetaceae bacterium]|nr:hypothetical protein [Planctomycetaceae bacterium]
MSNPERAITIANDKTLPALIHTACRRLIVVAPGLSTAVASAIVDQWRLLGSAAVSVVVDVDPEVYRLGYGDFSALQLLEKVAAELGTTLNRQPGIRIGLVIADDETLVYSPTPLLIEAGPHRTETPNAIRLGAPPQQIENELGRGPEGVRKQVVGLDKADIARISQVETSLKENPPQKFDVSRSVRVFNAAFEFVEFELSDTSVDRKTVPIPQHLSGIADERTREQLRTSYRILPPEHKLSGEHLKKDKELIAKKYLRNIPGHGNVVLRSRKSEFEQEVAKLRGTVEAFAESVRTDLQSAMDKTRETLTKSFLPLVKRTPPKEWCTSDGQKPDAETLRKFLDDDLKRAFGSAEQLIRQMDVRVVFKGVTYESLNNADFIYRARKAIPELADLYDEYDAARSVPGDQR